MFDFNCAAAKQPPIMRRRYFAMSAPKSAPLPRKVYAAANAENGFGNPTHGKLVPAVFKSAPKSGAATAATEPARFTYLNFNISGGAASTSRGRTERHRRKPVFDYVPWSLLDR
jgi:hypothetical protein